eukprot:TRINITY_DN18031_c0_g1_i1.p1 TRINITY_DN18031_c0_g1~~TRINITY_DN18031_c0_g1_i1.p1  ORF type:complete len:405 (+),score=65.93 TRINITY_DN18031_c0_g1_i1:269-1483(+)
MNPPTLTPHGTEAALTAVIRSSSEGRSSPSDQSCRVQWFQISLSQHGREWNVSKRYSQFLKLKEQLARLGVPADSFPRRHVFRSRSPSVTAARIVGLNHFLEATVLPSHHFFVVRGFLGLEAAQTQGEQACLGANRSDQPTDDRTDQRFVTAFFPSELRCTEDPCSTAAEGCSVGSAPEPRTNRSTAFYEVDDAPHRATIARYLDQNLVAIREGYSATEGNQAWVTASCLEIGEAVRGDEIFQAVEMLSELEAQLVTDHLVLTATQQDMVAPARRCQREFLNVMKQIDSPRWELQGSKPWRGISTYMWKDEQGRVSFKVVGDVTGDLFNIISLAYELDLYATWMPGCKHSTTLHHYSRFSLCAYLLFGAPWPAADREVLLKGYGDVNHQGVCLAFRSVDVSNPP